MLKIAITNQTMTTARLLVAPRYMALENSSKILAKNIANNTVMVVSHKYGTDMAAVTGEVPLGFYCLHGAPCARHDQ